MRTVAFQNPSAGAATLSWTVDRDCVIVGVSAVNTNAVVSAEPSLTWATVSTPGVSAILPDVIRIPVNGKSAPVFTTNIAIPLVENQKIYCAFDAAIGSCLLLLDELTIGS